MKRISLLFLALFPALLLISSCADFRQTKDLYDDWWPVHASGTFNNGKFSAKWDGDLGVHGDIVITYVSINNPSLSYDDTKYYPAYQFSKKKKAFCTVTIESLSDMHALTKFLGFKVKDGTIYFEIPNERGKGSGEYDEGHPLKFINDDTVQIGDVTYERYKVFKDKHPEVFKYAAEMGFDLDRLPVIDTE